MLAGYFNFKLNSAGRTQATGNGGKRTGTVRLPSKSKPTISLAQALKFHRVGIIGKPPLTEDDASNIKDAVVAVVCRRNSELQLEIQGMTLRNRQLITTVCVVEFYAEVRMKPDLFDILLELVAPIYSVRTDMR